MKLSPIVLLTDSLSKLEMDNRLDLVKTVQKLHKAGYQHGAIIEKKENGVFDVTDNVKICPKGRIRLVNFEKASKHRSNCCPSANSVKFVPRGCKELDDLYKLLRSKRSKERHVSKR